MKIKKNWFAKRGVIMGFAVISSLTGFLFMNHTITGNVILNENYPFTIVSVIGMLLVICAIILAVYNMKHK